MLKKRFKKLVLDMSSYELDEFTSSSFKYTHLSEDDAIEISRENQTELVRFGVPVDHNHMQYASMRNGKVNPFIGQVHSTFKATTWVKYSESYKKAIKDLANLVDFGDIELSAELCDLSAYLLPGKKKEKENKSEDRK